METIVISTTAKKLALWLQEKIVFVNSEITGH